MFRIRSFFKELEPTRQMSEAFRNCIFLALSGGFQDAYTYFTRDGVFANAQTGNVVLMSTNFMTGKWVEGLKYLFPILAFALGVLVADLIQKKFKYFKKIHWRQGILLFEIIILFAVGFMPKSMDTVAAVIVSFSCAMQVQTFRKVRGYSYASTMCIGNLRSGTAALSGFIHERKPEQAQTGNVLFWCYIFLCSRSRFGRKSFVIVWNAYNMGFMRIASCKFFDDV